MGLNQIDGSLIIVRVPLITDFSGLNNLNSIGGQLYIFENYSLETFIGLESLTSINGDITIDGNNSLLSFEGMGNLSASSINSLNILGNSSLSNCSVESICNYLSNPYGVVKIRNNAMGCNSPPEIAEGCGITLPCLPYGDYFFASQAQIDSFQTDYPECTELHGNTFIYGDDITNLIGLNVVTHFGNDLDIVSNPLLSTLHGLNDVDSIGGSLSLYNNPFIRHLTALHKLNYIGFDLYIGYNEHLMSLTGLDSLASIGHNFWIVHNPELIDIEGLTRLGSMGGYFHINGNLTLTSLNGLDNLDANTINGLQIRNNDSLSECEAKTICEYIANPNNSPSIYGNTIGCNSKEQVIEACLVDNPENSSNINYVSFYPNPANSEIVVQYTEILSNSSIIIYNLFF